MTTFAVTDQSQVIDALNYALSNLGQSTTANGTTDGNAVTINTTTGVIGQGGTVLSYLYRYLTVRYATSAEGAGITTNPIGATFFGVYNNNSQTPPDPTNPSNYQWTEATSPLSSTNQLYFSTLGGRQVQFFVGTSGALPQPTSNWVLVDSATPIDLDFVTATATLPLVVMTAFITSSNVANVPATPTGGTYDFGNLIFTAPSGWSNSIPGNSTAFFSSQNQFQATPTNSIVGPVDPWTTPVVTGKVGADGANGTPGTNGANGVSTYFYNVFQSANTAPSTPTGGYYDFGTSIGTPPSGWSNTPTSPFGYPIWATSAQVSSINPTANISIGSSWSSTFQYTGAGGAAGQRGFVPMAYVLTPSDPRVANSITLSQWFQAGTGGNVAPVGTGYIPVGGDTAAFTWSANTAIAPVYTYNSGNTTWTPANGQVINGNVFITGSVNANRLNANDVYSIKTASTNANVGNNNSFGYWFDSITGNARIAGNVSIGNTATIGNNLVIANNCSIGGNLTVAGLITGNGAGGANLNSNTVYTSTVVPEAITATDYFSTSTILLDVQVPTDGQDYVLGTTRGVNASSSGNVITVAGQYFTQTPILIGQQLTKTSGTGTLGANTVITNILSDSQITVSPTPSVPLSGAVVLSDPILDINVRTAPGIYISTTGPNDAVQLNFTGSFNIDGSVTALNASLYATCIGFINILRYNYVPGQPISVQTPTLVYTQLLTFPIVFRTAAYSQALTYSLSSVIDQPGASGSYVYIPSLAGQTLTGTWGFIRVAQQSMAASGTVLKR